MKYNKRGLRMKKGDKFRMTKDDVLEHSNILPTTKVSRLIVRQTGHPLGDWEISKPTRKHVYVMEVV